MTAYNQEALEALHEVRDTMLRIRNEGRIEMLNMRHFIHPCRTKFCIAGYHALFNTPASMLWEDREQKGMSWSVEIPRRVYGITDYSDPANSLRILLFGGGQGYGEAAWQKQMRRVQWLIRREEKRRDYMSMPDLSRKERRALDASYREAA